MVGRYVDKVVYYLSVSFYVLICTGGEPLITISVIAASRIDGRLPEETETLIL